MPALPSAPAKSFSSANSPIFACSVFKSTAGAAAMAQIVTVLMNLAMRMEREQFLGAGHYERAVDRRGYANGTKAKLIGTLSLEVPKTAGTCWVAPSLRDLLIVHRQRQFENASAANCARSGTPRTSPSPKPSPDLPVTLTVEGALGQ
jgi:hypothetical protein